MALGIDMKNVLYITASMTTTETYLTTSSSETIVTSNQEPAKHSLKQSQQPQLPRYIYIELPGSDSPDSFLDRHAGSETPDLLSRSLQRRRCIDVIEFIVDERLRNFIDIDHLSVSQANCGVTLVLCLLSFLAPDSS